MQKTNDSGLYSNNTTGSRSFHGKWNYLKNALKYQKCYRDFCSRNFQQIKNHVKVELFWRNMRPFKMKGQNIWQNSNFCHAALPGLMAKISCEILSNISVLHFKRPHISQNTPTLVGIYTRADMTNAVRLNLIKFQKSSIFKFI